MPSNNLKTGFYRNSAKEHSFPADRLYHSGEIIQVLGRVGIVQGERQREVGEEVGVCFDVTADVVKADRTLAIVKGDPVGYLDVTDANTPMTAVAGGAGTFDIGIATKDSPAGHPQVEVIFPFGS